jgi:hypothetical protein
MANHIIFRIIGTDFRGISIEQIKIIIGSDYQFEGVV